MKAKFPVISDNIQAVTTIYNYRNLSISPLDFDIDIARIDILYEKNLYISFTYLLFYQFVIIY